MKFLSLLTVLSLTIFSTGTESALGDTPPTFELIQLGINGNAAKDKMYVKLKISGGNSSSFNSCSTYLGQQHSRIGLWISEKGLPLKGPFWSGASGSANVKTLSLDAKGMICEFFASPSYSMTSNVESVDSEIVLLYDSKEVIRQRVKLWNPSLVPPKISIRTPERGRAIKGELKIDFNSDAGDIWTSRETFAYVVEGWEAPCRGGGGSRANLNSIGQLGTSAVLRNDGVSSQVWPLVRVEAYRTGETSLSFYIQESGKYVVCVGQSFSSKFNPNPPDPNTNEIEFANAGVAIEYIAEPRDVTLDVNDVRLKRLETSVNNFITSNLVCPKTVKRGLKSITCTLSSNIFPFSDSNIQKLGYPPGSKVTLTGSELEYVVCVRAENWGGVACQNDLDLIPAYYAHIKSISLNVGQSVKFSVPNYLSKTGYTSIECGGPGCEEFGGEYEVKGYKSPDVRRATAVPTASEQKRIVGVIKKSMNERCQKLPSNFLSFQGKYVKRVTSQSGLYGYVFLLGSKVSIQIYEVGDIYWTFGPSPTKADNKTWESWGCGRTGIQTYG